ncbi:MAG TPA: serine hydrolase [Steroidobacteraceae bacterium]|nr:serine hydrolase [Steroidobacteraceae bacterium]
MNTRASRLTSLGLVALLTACGGGGGASPSPAPSPGPPQPPVTIDISQPWATAQPVEEHMDGVKLARATNDASAIPRFRSLLVARHGKLVLEDYFGGATASTAFDVRSVTKSVLSLLVGDAVAAGKISLDTTVGDYFGAPYVLDAGDRAVNVRQLLTMTSRYQWNENTGDDYNLWALSTDHVQFLFDRAQNDAAGTFTYNSAAVSLLGNLLQRAVGEPLPQYANEQLFTPLGITAVNWEELEPGMVNAGSGIQLAARDLLRVGQLFLQRGQSGTLQIAPAAWIDDASKPKFAWRDTYGAQASTSYGYLWWVADSPAIPVAFAWGYGGQFIYVVPSLDMVVVATTNWQGVSAETDPGTFATRILTIIVSDVVTSAN